MKQLAQKLMDGRMEIIDVPTPVASNGTILVRNAFSVISAGTEGSKVSAARKGLIGKAKDRPQQARQMVDLLRQAGPVQAYRTAMKKLDSYSPLGYSSAGLVIGLGGGVSGFSIGDKVACAGAGASHSEIVVVPQNLCVALHPDADLQLAAYNTLGAVALQGIRQADLRVGETCVVIGLGLLGQLTCLLLRSSGNKVFGVDINPEMVKLASARAAHFAAERSEIGLAERIVEFTNGIGADAVIITAASASNDPINFSGQILRRKGTVVVVGNVPTGFERDPYYYQKELNLRMSCSYGPGRYDPVYEEKGIDYPPEYVRWTERRNMEAFQHLIHSRSVEIGYLTTHVFDFEEAARAYDLITERREPYLGIMISYAEASSTDRKIYVDDRRASAEAGAVGIAFIGAGSYAMSHLLPNIPKERYVERIAVMTASGLSSRTAAEKFAFGYCTSDEADIFQNPAINTVFIATRHDTHAAYVKRALSSGKNVFVEKPLCLHEYELDDITGLLTDQMGTRGIVLVGFNRRFSPLVEYIRQNLPRGPMSMTYRINAGVIPPDSWIQDRELGGGRVIGEVCHFIDLLTYINGSLPEKVQAFGMRESSKNQDTVTINLKFENGSIGVISYFANGPKKLPKEYLEIYSGGATAILRDFKEAEILYENQSKTKRLIFQDKGQAAMVKAFINAVKSGDRSPIPFEETLAVMRATFRAVQSLTSASVIAV